MNARLSALSAILTLFAAGSTPAAEPDVEEILRRHAEARGGLAAIRALDNVVYSGGTYREPGYEGSGNAFMALARPHRKVVGDPENPGGFMEGWDGSAWEWFADPGMVIRTVGEASAAARHGNDLESRLIEPEAKGATATLGPTIDVDGRPAHQVTLTLADGFSVDYFLDGETYLVVAEKMTAPIHAFGEDITRWTRVSDYREIGGVLFAFRHTETEISTGRAVSSMEWGKIEVNRDLPASWFAPPVFERSVEARFLEGLYHQRTDPSAVLWSYGEFRRTHPEIDVQSNIEFVGYQMIKMADAFDSAVALLERNLAEHPDSADAAFALGRAFATKGDAAAARGILERALELDPEHSRARTLLESLG